MNRFLSVAAFLAGLLAVLWVGAGYVGSSPLALTMTALIGAVYLAGAIELQRFHRATTALTHALGSIPDALLHPGEWIATLPPTLRNAVRLRLEGERVGLPGPALTPYLVGLLVLLGMLGTFLGMVVTLNGAVLALESTTDLHTIRSALAAPVKGLGLAFGTSVAGVSASAMLGLISALCRRARLQAGQQLDSRIATDLREFSLAHQRQETYRAMQRQADSLPAVVDRLQALIDRIEQRDSQSAERLQAEQERFHRDARETYTALAAAVDASLKDSLSASARLAGETIRPVVEATMRAIASEAGALHARVGDDVAAQLDGIASRFDAAVGTVAATWTAALARHEQTSSALAHQLETTLAGHAATFEQGADRLLTSVGSAHAGLQAELSATTTALLRDNAAMHAGVATAVQTQLDGLVARFGEAVGTVADTWTQALAHHQGLTASQTDALRAALQDFAASFSQRAAELLAAVDSRAITLQNDLAAADEARLGKLGDTLEAMAGTLQREWQQAGAAAAGREAELCRTLDETARSIAAEARSQAAATIDEVARLMEGATEAPRVAAEVIGELRKELSAGIARDNERLDERARLMATLNTLLETIDHTAGRQREAIDGLVAAASTVLEHAGDGFARRVESESARIVEAAAQISGGAIEVASLGEAFTLAMARFAEASAQLTGNLQRIEAALDKAMTRSDEQLAYYVAQAREIIDLSLMSQQQIVEDLQQLAPSGAQRAGAA